jgi:CRP-like cAMP-binding protein
MPLNNRFLESLSPETLAELTPHLTSVDLPLKAVIQAEGAPTQWVYFPLTAVLSFMTTGIEGIKVQTSIVGNEGAAGLLEACGSQSYRMDTQVQIDGAAFRAPAHICRRLAQSSADFSLNGLKLSELLLAESRRSVYCQAVHSSKARFARWLSECADRSSWRKPLPLTQEFLAAMLGIQRTTVSVHANELRNLGAIEYTRGKVTISDRQRLEAVACECRAYTAEQRRVLGFEPMNAVLAANDDAQPGRVPTRF